MSPPGRPKGEYRSVKREGSLISSPGAGSAAAGLRAAHGVSR